MKTYFRLLSFAKPIEKFAIPYILYTLLYVVFSSLTFPLLIPLLTLLFSQNGPVRQVLPHPTHFLDVTGWFKYYMADIIHRSKNGEWVALKYVCSLMIGAMVTGNLFRYLSGRTMENLRQHTLLKLRRAVFNNVMDLHLGYFSNQRKGDIISKIASDVQVVQFSVTATLQVIFRDPAQMLVFLFLLLKISVSLTLWSLLVVPISAFVISKIVKKLRSQARAAQQTYGTMVSYIDEALSGIKIVKAFNATGYIKRRFDTENERYSKILRSMANRQQAASPVSETFAAVMIACIVLYGGYLILNKQSNLTGPEFVTYIIIFSQLMRPAKSISDAFSNIHSGIAAGERVLTMIDEKPGIVDAPDAIALSGFHESVRFDNVSFAYEDKEVLSGINIEVPVGKTVALVGPSGGGKSTLMDLIPRFIEPKSGRILIDGHDIQHVKMDSLRSLMGIVNQESILFNDTIFNNIAFGKTDATAEEVETAAKIANAHNFITETDNGYQTNIGDRGTKLSGGQRQRICIARAVLNNPPLMLLDEATSALDTESEKLVQEALNNLMKNRTSLIIAHRLSTIQNADMIIVLESGKVVEQGTHQQLLEANGLYRKLIDMQTFNAG